MTALEALISANTETVERPAGVRRPWRDTLRRHWLLWVFVLAGVSVPVFLGGALLKRTYVVGATFDVGDRTGGEEEFGLTAGGAAADEVRQAAARVPYAGVSTTALRVDARTGDGGRTQVRLSARTDRRDEMLALMGAAIELYSRERAWKSEEDVTQTRLKLAREVKDLHAALRAAEAAVGSFGAESGGTGEGMAAASKRLDDVAKELSEKQHKLTVIIDTIGRTEKQRGQAKISVSPAPPGTTSAPATAPDRDAEVMQLRAQLRLLAEQLEDQLTVQGRTEQHPYVVDLRAKQEALQKRLDAAMARAASGKPAPESARALMPQPDPGQSAAEQAVEFRLAQLYSERDALETDVATLKLQHEKAKKDVAVFAPRQKEFAALIEQQKAAAATYEAANQKLARFDKAFATRGGAAAGRAVEITEPTFIGAGARPVWPTFPAIASLALGAGMIAAFATIRGVDAMHRGFRGPREFASVVGGVTILGTVSEIRTPGQRHRLRAWRGVGRPVVGAVLAVCILSAAGVCYVSLGGRGTSVVPALSSADIGTVPAARE